MFYKKPSFKIFVSYVIARIILSTWMFVVRDLFPIPIDNSNFQIMHIPVETNPWFEPWQRWDTIHYQAIAIHGYESFDSALFTPPLYPFLIRLITPITCNNSLYSALLISNIAFLISLFLLFKVAFFETGNETVALKVIFILLLYPVSFFFLAGYTESLFLLWTILMINSLQHQKWLVATISIGLACLTRVTGFLLFIPFIYSVACQNKGNKQQKLIPYIFLAGLLYLIFPLYIYFGLKLPVTAIFQAVSRGGRIAFPGLNILIAINQIIHGEMIYPNILEICSIFLLMILIRLGWKKYSMINRLLGVSFLFFYLIRLGNPQPLIGMARYTIVVLPIYFSLAEMKLNKPSQKFLIILTLFLQLFLAGQFSIGGWVG